MHLSYIAHKKWKLAIFSGLFISILVAGLLSSCTSDNAWWKHARHKSQTENHLISASNADFWPRYGKTLHFAAQYEHKADVEQQIRWIQKHPLYFKQLLHNARPYIFYIDQQTASRHLPAELALIPMIESAYDPFRYSKAGATGLWDLMPGTASGLNVPIDWWFDGRRDIITSTKASLSYLAYLGGKFKNWTLAIPAYDSGAGLIEKAVANNRHAHLSTDLWSLNLPLETKAYLPKLLAIANIIRHPKKYGFNMPYLASQPQFQVFKMNRQLNLTTIAKLADVPLATIQRLNPGFRRWATKPHVTYTCLIPTAKATHFVEHFSQAANIKKKLNWQRHVIASGDNLSRIAKDYHTKASVILAVNHLQKNSILHPGKTLFIPAGWQQTPDELPELKGSSGSRARHHRISSAWSIHSSLAEDRLPGPQEYHYTVKKSDSFQHIARAFHVKVRNIYFWNQLSHKHHLQVGEQLTLWSKRHPQLTSYSIYHVKAGDNLFNIAHSHHMRLHALALLNPNLNPKKALKLGEKVRVKYG